jgi:hypothetical protein
MSADAVTVLEEASCDAGIQGDEAELIRMGENALLRLPHDRIVVRIARSIDVLRDAPVIDRIYPLS